MLLYKASLVTKVDPTQLDILFSPLKQRDTPLSDITHREARTYNLARDYEGWEVKTARRGGAYNVSGNREVEMWLRNDKRLLVESQRSGKRAAATTLVKSERGERTLGPL